MAAPVVFSPWRRLVPAMVALLLLVLCMIPVSLNVPITPHVVWLMTLTVGMLTPAAWSVTVAFTLGLVSDFVSGTPLGAQALLTLLLTVVVHGQARRASHQLFRIRWLEASLTLIVLYFLLWVITGWVVPNRPPLLQVMLGAVVSALWYPVFYGLATQLAKLLPGKN